MGRHCKDFDFYAVKAERCFDLHSEQKGDMICIIVLKDHSGLQVSRGALGRSVRRLLQWPSER